MEPSIAIQALGSSNVDERRQAAEACAKNTDLAQAAVIPLCRCCADEDEQVSEWANGALEELGPPAKEELPALIDLLTAAAPTAYWAATLVGRLEEAGSPALPQLAAAINQPETPPEVRDRAIWAIGKIGSGDASVREALQKAAASDNPRTARLAASALEKL
ncbi:HEAT repeat domain-containing protein [Bremerella sp. JC817]|uniref:HEAT repeat domain-containing protein n=1 Tax=Bremerella sp. JC817 TaxID=3231756 RepID=UPI0034576766